MQAFCILKMLLHFKLFVGRQWVLDEILMQAFLEKRFPNGLEMSFDARDVTFDLLPKDQQSTPLQNSQKADRRRHSLT